MADTLNCPLCAGRMSSYRHAVWECLCCGVIAGPPCAEICQHSISRDAAEPEALLQNVN